MNALIKDAPDTDTSAKRGRKATGATRADIEKAASEKHRKKKLQSGKCELKAFVDLDTKTKLAQLKINLGVDTLGEVIDVLTQQYKKSEEKS